MTRERIIRRILRVNHAGEHGAVAIYASQVALARRLYPELLPWLEDTISHERVHRERFRAAMPSRNAKPCRLLGVWTIGGSLLGVLTGLLGRSGVMICTAAVERTVQRHLLEQIAFLDQADPSLAATVRAVLEEEDQHLSAAEDALREHRSVTDAIVGAVVAAATEVLIFVSTRGDSLRLRTAMSGV